MLRLGSFCLEERSGHTCKDESLTKEAADSSSGGKRCAAF